eukprot:Skav220040  [mRNA]  locus=scaffold2981:259455:271618:+ [translate_table: standard]
MPPRAKAKGKAKAKAKAKAVAKAHPKAKAKAGAFARRRGRPAAAPRGPPGREAGEEVDLSGCGVREVLTLGKIVVKGSYWDSEVSVCGFPRGLHQEGEEYYVKLEVEGTQSEDILRYVTGRRDRQIWIHLCEKPCSARVWKDGIIHVESTRKVKGPEEDWMSNVAKIAPGHVEEEVDELVRLREEAEAAPALGVTPAGREEAVKKKEKENKKKKEKKTKEASEKKPKGKKGLEEVYGGTGMDPSPSKRRSVKRAARKVAKSHKKKKKKKGGSSSSSRSGSSSAGSESRSKESKSDLEGREEDLFGESSLVRKLSKRYPGVLTADWVKGTQEYLMDAQGQMWTAHQGELPPVGVHYFRSHVSQKMSGPMAREYLSLVYTLDLMLQGHMAQAADVITQRLKSLQASNSGIHYTVAPRLELLPHDRQAPASLEETQEAARAVRQEELVMQRAAKAGRPWGSPPSTDFNKGGKGKEGKGKKGKAKEQKGKESSKGTGSGGNEGKGGRKVEMRESTPGRGVGKDAVKMGYNEEGVMGGAVTPHWEVSPPKGRLGDRVSEVVTENLKHVQFFKEVGSIMVQCFNVGCKPPPIAKVVDATSSSSTLAAGTVPDEMEERPWREAVLQGFTHLAGGPDTTDGRVLRSPAVSKSVSLQLSRFDMWDEPFVTTSFHELFASKGVDYSGEEVKLAQDLCWEAVLNSLPLGVGQLKLEDFCTLGTKHFVENFEEYLTPANEQLPVKAPKVMVRDGDWPQLCKGLVERNICGFMPLSEVHCIQGKPLLNGLFAVGKNEYVGTLETQRLIMNLTPVNTLCGSLQGDIGTLPALSGLNALVLEDGQQIMVSSEDVRCFFYLFALPTCWHRYLAFSRLVPDEVLPTSLRGRACVLFAKVLPMGYCNSVSIAQHVHRNVVRWSNSSMVPPIGGEGELRRDKGVSAKSSLYRVYLDNFDQLELVSKSTADLIRGVPSEQVLQLRQTYETLQLPRHEKKATVRANRAEVQGALVLGDVGVAIPRPSKVVKYVALGLQLLVRKQCTLRELQVVCGGFVYLCTFRRPLLCSLNAVWAHMELLKGVPPVVRLPLPDGVVMELVRFLSLVPLCQMFFASKLSPQVTCSDASMDGGGICVSSSLTSYGERAAQAQVRGDVMEEADWEQVLTVGLFDGIGALRVACGLLQLPMIGHISIESNKEASRVVESFFPDTWFHDDVQTVDKALVEKFALRYSNAAIVLIGAGPPCQGVSQLNFDRRGALRDHRSKLFKEVPRVTGLFQQAFPWAQVHQLMENVFSMDTADRTTMTAELEVLPWKVDSCGISLCRRPRLYWLSWELHEEEGAQLSFPMGDDYSCFGEAILEAPVDASSFLEKGWHLAGEHLPTFTTARPSAKPGRKPAGLHQLEPHEEARWRADNHRFPPYQYQQTCGVVNAKGEWRTPSVSEREAVLGFPVGYTKMCVAKTYQKGVDFENKRLSLLGNSWHVGVIAWLLSQLFGRLGIGPVWSLRQVVQALVPGHGRLLQSVLLRPPLCPSGKASAPLQEPAHCEELRSAWDEEDSLVRQLQQLHGSGARLLGESEDSGSESFAGRAGCCSLDLNGGEAGGQVLDIAVSVRFTQHFVNPTEAAGTQVGHVVEKQAAREQFQTAQMERKAQRRSRL